LFSKLSTASVSKLAILLFIILIISSTAYNQELKKDAIIQLVNTKRNEFLADSLKKTQILQQHTIDSVLRTIVKLGMNPKKTNAMVDSVLQSIGIKRPDSMPPTQFGAKNLPDGFPLKQPSQANDTTSKNKSGLEAKVEYEAVDSIRFELEDQKVFLFKKAKIKYEKINMEAGNIQIHFKENLLFAKGVSDSTGNMIGRPVFTEGSKSYKSKFMKYNYKTNKGFIKDAFTKESEGYVHGKAIKKFKDNDVNISGGSFTTCDCEDCPHFEFRFKKSKVIPGNKIITGPAYFVIENIPTPLFLPFAIFPQRPGQRSGIIIPSYGDSESKGFYLQNGGYYWAINDYFDLKILGDIYTYGSWALKPTMNYAKRYKYRGSIS
jgi:lipopolysaccharide assembly outer membrane protein LptD (OstA)